MLLEYTVTWSKWNHNNNRQYWFEICIWNAPCNEIMYAKTDQSNKTKLFHFGTTSISLSFDFFSLKKSLEQTNTRTPQDKKKFYWFQEQKMLLGKLMSFLFMLCALCITLEKRQTEKSKWRQYKRIHSIFLATWNSFFWTTWNQVNDGIFRLQLCFYVDIWMIQKMCPPSSLSHSHIRQINHFNFNKELNALDEKRKKSQTIRLKTKIQVEKKEMQ